MHGAHAVQRGVRHGRDERGCNAAGVPGPSLRAGRHEVVLAHRNERRRPSLYAATQGPQVSARAEARQVAENSRERRGLPRWRGARCYGPNRARRSQGGVAAQRGSAIGCGITASWEQGLPLKAAPDAPPLDPSSASFSATPLRYVICHCFCTEVQPSFSIRFLPSTVLHSHSN